MKELWRRLKESITHKGEIKELRGRYRMRVRLEENKNPQRSKDQLQEALQYGARQNGIFEVKCNMESGREELIHIFFCFDFIRHQIELIVSAIARIFSALFPEAYFLIYLL